MKKSLFFLLLSSIFFTGYSQTTTKLLSGQANPYRQVSPDNFLYVDTTPAGMYRIYPTNMDSLKLKYLNIKWINDTIISIGNGRYAQLLGSYSNPNFIQSLSSSKVFGLSSVAL